MQTINMIGFVYLCIVGAIILAVVVAGLVDDWRQRKMRRRSVRDEKSAREQDERWYQDYLRELESRSAADSARRVIR